MGTTHCGSVEHPESSLVEKEAQANKLVDANATLTYNLARARLRVLYLEQALRSWKDSTDAQHAEVNRLQKERDAMARALDTMRLQLELAHNVIFMQFKLSTLEGVPVGIPDLEEGIEKTRRAMEEDKLNLNAASPKRGLSEDEEIAKLLEDTEEEPSRSRSDPSTP